MDKRQKARLDKDIDFYEKRLTGEVKKKNTISRYIDNERSFNIARRATGYAIVNIARNAIPKYMQKGMPSNWEPSDVVSMFIGSIMGTAQDMAVSELYNRAIGRY